MKNNKRIVLYPPLQKITNIRVGGYRAGIYAGIFLGILFFPIASNAQETDQTGMVSSPSYVDEMNVNVGYVQGQRRMEEGHQEMNIRDVERPIPYEQIEIIGEGPRYTIGQGDILQIMVRNQKDFTGRFVVNDNGYIQYNWVGDVKAAGQTKEELKLILKEKLTKFVRFPEVSVIILEYRSKFVFDHLFQPEKYF